MRTLHILAVSGCLVLALAATAANAQGTMANTAAPKMMTLQMPALPEPAHVTLNPKTTALLALDYVDPICVSQPKCKGEMLPKAAALMQQARKAGVVVAYGTRDRTMSRWLPEVAPMAGDIKIPNTAQDRFYNTDLDKELKAKGVTTIIIIGWKASGSVAYTTVGANLRDFTVVVPVDTTASATDYETTIGFYNILNQGETNLTNMPLKPKTATLSRSDMITFQ